ncbi:MAG: cobalamin/Fe(3+)-siderophore ABC transporter ATP-binding protein, partial [Acidimicrobiaceae bacterium]|nr:cobalamin/Fe(3+)-siderophore ABC transporter ATP-binding protein [Acidimicrobiaceae bacterium]
MSSPAQSADRTSSSSWLGTTVHSESEAPTLSAEGLTLSYGGPDIVTKLGIVIPPGEITAIIGANGCGKSTLLRALARLLRPVSGAVILDGEAINEQPTKAVARRLGLLPQAPRAPEGVIVSDLVRRGRYPHQKVFQQWSPRDEEACERAMRLTDMLKFEGRPVDELSGGQRQRAWIAMALAQDTPLMLLDEPTTYLDIAHQVDVLELLKQLNANEGRTIVMVLHDLNLASRYANHLVAVADGGIVAEGAPGEVITSEIVERVFGLPTVVIEDPVTGSPL